MDLDRLAFTFFNPEIAREYWPDIAKGFVITVQLGLAVIVTGLGARPRARDGALVPASARSNFADRRLRGRVPRAARR